MYKNFALLVASVLHGHQGQAEVSHAMVLDKFDENNDTLIFKNTYDDQENGQPKQFAIKRTDPNAPEELYFVHIEMKDMNVANVGPIRRFVRLLRRRFVLLKRHLTHYRYDHRTKILIAISLLSAMFIIILTFSTIVLIDKFYASLFPEKSQLQT